MPDKIMICDLLLRAIIGVNPDERERPQNVIINVTLETDARAAGASDNLADAINYASLARRIGEMVESSEYHLIERLAEEIARICLEDARVSQAVVRVDKPRALRYARAAAVEIVRRQADYTGQPVDAHV